MNLKEEVKAKDIEVTYFKRITCVNDPQVIKLEYSLEEQKSDRVHVSEIRYLNNTYKKDFEKAKSYLLSRDFNVTKNLKTVKELCNFLKKNLEVLCVSGIFSSRDKLGCTSHSGLYMFDYDDIIDKPIENEKLLELRSKLINDPYVLSCFLSPSGLGLKVLIRGKRLEGSGLELINIHETNYKSIQHYLYTQYGVKLDENCFDVSRACFFSSDKDIYINYESEVFKESNLSIFTDIDIKEKKINRKENKKDTSIITNKKPNIDNPFEINPKKYSSRIPKDLLIINEYNKEYIKTVLIKIIENLSEFLQYKHGKNMRNSFFKFIVAMTDIIEPNKVRELASLFGCQEQNYIDDAIKNVDRLQSNFIYILCMAIHYGLDLVSISINILNDNPEFKISDEKIIQKELFKYYDIVRNSHNGDLKLKLKTDPNSIYRVLDDFQENDLIINMKLYSNFKTLFRKDSLDMVLNSSLIGEYNPVEDFLKTLRDNKTVDSLRNVFIYSLGIEESDSSLDLKVTIFKKYMASIIDKSLNGSQNDKILILYGGMNLGKTRFLKKLFGFFVNNDVRSYFTVVPKIDIYQKDDLDKLRSNYIINLDELNRLNDIDLKQFTSSEEIVYREPYKRHNKKFINRCTLMGTTNNIQFLKDRENRRFFILHIEKKINEVYLTDEVLNDIWFEAYRYYQENRETGLFFNDEEINLISKLSENHRVMTDLEEIILDNFEADVKPNLTATEVVRFLKDLTNTNYYSNQVGISLRKNFGDSVATSKSRVKKYKIKLILKNDIDSIEDSITTSVN
jgi:predicted P-loop ATPase